MTYTRASNLRRLAAELPPEALVLETDAPDMAPAWLHSKRNGPEQLPRIAAVLAELRGITPDMVMHITSNNACAALSLQLETISQHGST